MERDHNEQLQEENAILKDKLEAYNKYLQEIRRAKMISGMQMCACGCERIVPPSKETGRKRIYFSDACRKRVNRLQKKLGKTQQKRNKAKYQVEGMVKRQKKS